MSEPGDKPPYRLIYAGLAFAILAQIGVLALFVTEPGFTVFPIGNIIGGIFAAGAAWLIRQRQKGRL